MRKNFGAKCLMYPMPVLIVAAYDEAGVPNAMNAAWGCICDYDKVAVVLDKGHKTTANILKKKAFTVSMAGRLKNRTTARKAAVPAKNRFISLTRQ